MLWLALQRLQLAEPTEYGKDSRVDTEYVEDLEPRLPFDGLITTEECLRVGLPPNPEYEDFEAGDYHLPLERIRELIEAIPDERARLEADLAESEAMQVRQKA